MLHTVKVCLFLTLWPTAEFFFFFFFILDIYVIYKKKNVFHIIRLHIYSITPPFAYSKENACNLWRKI